jgi:hypothetical protein
LIRHFEGQSLMKRQLHVAALMAVLGLVGATRAGAQLTQTDPNGLAFLASLTTDSSGLYEILNSGSVFDGALYVPPNPGYGGGVMWMAGPTAGGPAPYPNEEDTNFADGLQSYAEYTVRFTDEGMYRLFISGQRTGPPQGPAEGGMVLENDSFWVGRLDVDHTNTNAAKWHNFSIPGGAITYLDTTVDWLIDSTTVDTDLTLTIGMREDGPVFDRLAFVRSGSGITAATIATSLPIIERIPEPGTWAMGAIVLGGVVLLGRRRGSPLRGSRFREDVLVRPSER